MRNPFPGEADRTSKPLWKRGSMTSHTFQCKQKIVCFRFYGDSEPTHHSPRACLGRMKKVSNIFDVMRRRVAQTGRSLDVFCARHPAGALGVPARIAIPLAAD